MGRIALQPSTLYFPGVHTLDGQAHDISQRYPGLPEKDQGTFFHEGTAVPYYLSRAKQERNVIVGCSGLNSHYLLSKEEIDDLNSRGLSVIWMALPLTRHSKNFMPDFTSLAEAFFTSPNSPAMREFSLALPRYALTHSTGSQIFLKLMHDKVINRQLAHIFSGVLHMAPFFDTAFSSLEYPRLMQKTFEDHCNKHKDECAGDGLIGRTYLKILASHEHYARAFTPQTDENGHQVNLWGRLQGGIKTLFDHYTRDIAVSGPTYGQVMEVRTAGRKLQEEFNTAAVASMPHVIVADMKDRFACTRTTVRMAELMDAKLVLSGSGGHDPMNGRADLRADFITMVEECAKIKERAHQRFIAVPEQNYFGTENLPPYTPSLGDRARVALQSGASLLNAGTSFAQGLFARRI